MRNCVAPTCTNWRGRATMLAGLRCWVMGARSCALLPARVFTCFARVVRRFALLGARGFLDTLIFLELAFKVLFSIEIR